MYTLFKLGFESRSMNSPKNNTPLDYLAPYLRLSKWRSLWPPLFTPRWPPVWFTSFFNPDLSSAPWKTPKMTPYLTILCLTLKLSKWRSLWPPLFIPRWPPVWFTFFSARIWVQHPRKTRKWHITWLYWVLHQNCQNGGHFDLHFLPRWPPVWCTHFLNSDLSPEAWIPPKMTPHLTILHPTSKLSKWRSLWPPLFFT